MPLSPAGMPESGPKPFVLDVPQPAARATARTSAGAAAALAMDRARARFVVVVMRLPESGAAYDAGFRRHLIPHAKTVLRPVTPEALADSSRPMRIRLLVPAVCLAWLACSAPESGFAPSGPDGGVAVDGATPGATPLPCDVDAVLASKCRDCHQNPPQFSAPMPLVTWEDLHAPSKSDPSTPVYVGVHARTHDTQRPMPPAPRAPLDAASLATLDAWYAAGAPVGDGTCGPAADGGVVVPRSDAAPAYDASLPADCVPEHIVPASKFTMTGPEEYACYGFDVTAAQKRHVTAISIHLDNTKIIHHALLLKSATSTSGTPLPCNPAPSLGLGMVYAWAPGGPPMIVPPEAGFPEDSTTHYIVQIHYNNAANVPNPTDGSGFDLCTTSTLRPNDADVVAFGSEAIVIAPRSAADLITCYTVPSAMDGRHFFAAFPHMHQLGKSMSTERRNEAGPPVDMGTDTSWDFSTQPWLPIDAVLHTGDVVRVHCAWNNSTGNYVTFGQGTSNEMCYSFSAYYPAISPSLGWGAPAQGSIVCQ
jgi:hypothetical protein